MGFALYAPDVGTTVSSAEIENDSIVDADLKTDAAISHSKLAALTSTNLLVGSSANVPTSRAVTGDVTIGNTGVTAIASDTIVNADVKSDAAIAYSKLNLATSLGVADLTAAARDALLPWRIDIEGLSPPDLNTGFENFIAGGYAFTRYCTALNDEVGWDVILAAGTWDVQVWHWHNTDEGLFTAYIDAASIGTHDCNAASDTGIRTNFTGNVVATTGKKRIRIKCTTATGGSVIAINGIFLRRTA